MTSCDTTSVAITAASCTLSRASIYTSSGTPGVTCGINAGAQQEVMLKSTLSSARAHSEVTTEDGNFKMRSSPQQPPPPQMSHQLQEEAAPNEEKFNARMREPISYIKATLRLWNGRQQPLHTQMSHRLHD